MRDDTEESLVERVAAFKNDPEKIREANDFVNELIQQAKKEAELKQKVNERSKFESLDQDNGNLKKRFGRTRTFFVRMFDAICNCTQTAAAAAARTTRNNPFTKR